MTKSMNIARKTIDDKIVKRESFSWDDLQDEIIENKGILRINPGYTVGDYLTDLEKRGIIEFDSYSQRFMVLELVE